MAPVTPLNDERSKSTFYGKADGGKRTRLVRTAPATRAIDTMTTTANPEMNLSGFVASSDLVDARYVLLHH